MALKLGELVAIISADDSGFHRVLNRAEAGLKRVGKIGALTALAGAASQLAVALGPAAGGLLSLGIGAGAAVAPVAGLAVALPAVAVTWKTAMGIMKLAVSDLGDALSASVDGDQKKFEAGLKKLPPSARTVAKEIGGALSGLKGTVQEAFFKPISAQAAGLGAQLRGPLQSGMATAAAGLGRLAARAAAVAREGRSIQVMRGVFDTIAVTADRAGRGVAPLLRGLRELVAVGLSRIPAIGTAVGNVAANMGRWLQSITASGKASRWFDKAIDTLKQLGRIGLNIGVVLGHVFGAATAGATNFLGPLQRVTERLADWTRSAEGRTALLNFFAKGREQLAQFGRIAANLGSALAGIFKQAGTGSGDLIANLEKLTERFAAWVNSAKGQQQIGQTFQMLQQVTHDLVTIMPGLVVILGQVAGFITSLPGPVRSAVSQFLAWSIVLGLVSSKFGPLIQGLGKTPGVIGKIGKSFGNDGASRNFVSRMGGVFASVGRGAKQAATQVGRAAASMAASAGRGAAAAGRLAMSGLKSAASAAASAGRAAASFAVSAGRMAASAATTAASVIGAGLRMAGQMALAVGRVVVGWTVMAARAVISAAIMAAQWLIAFWPVALVVAAAAIAVALIIKYWDQIVAFFTKTLPHWLKVGFDFIVGIIKKGAELGFFGPVGLIITHWNSIVTFFTKTLPHWIGVGFDFMVGLIKKAASVGFLGPIGLIISHWNSISSFFTKTLPNAVSSGINTVIGWLRRLPGQVISAVGNTGKLLYNAGRNILIGLWNGLVSMSSWLARSLTNLVKSIVPGPVLKVLGIRSPSKLFASYGRFLAMGLAKGMHDNAGLVSSAAGALAGVAATGGVPRAGVHRPTAGPPGGAAGGTARVALDFTGADGAFKQFIRKIVRVDGRGNVQVAFGTG